MLWLLRIKKNPREYSIYCVLRNDCKLCRSSSLGPYELGQNIQWRQMVAVPQFSFPYRKRIGTASSSQSKDKQHQIKSVATPRPQIATMRQSRGMANNPYCSLCSKYLGLIRCIHVNCNRLAGQHTISVKHRTKRGRNPFQGYKIKVPVLSIVPTCI